jgi:hypothetical protein
MAFFETLSLYWTLFIKSWQPSPVASSSPRAGRSLYRLVVMLGFWLIFIVAELCNGFFLALDYLLFPQFKSVKVQTPLFVVGVPRSGTTFLHRLLARDEERFTTMSLAELIFAPAISQKLIWRFVAKVDNALGGWLQKIVHGLDRLILGGLDDVHQTGLWDPEEDYLGLIPTLGCFLLVLPFPFPEMWRLAYFDRDLNEPEKLRILRAYERLVQRHLYVFGENKLLLSKNPSFTPMICALADYFTEAKFIACFRNPSKSIPSQINSMLIGARIFHGKVDSDYWRDHLSEMLQFYYHHLLEELPKFPDNRHGVSVMEELVKAPKQKVLDLYETLNLRASDAYVEALQQEEDRAKQYKSKHQYSLEHLAISEQRLVADFGFVYAHFGFPLPQGEAKEAIESKQEIDQSNEQISLH